MSPSRLRPNSVGGAFIWILLAHLLVGSAGCARWLPNATAPAPAPHPNQECLPHFPDEDGWFGGDAAFSVPFGNHSLWFFGDSFVQRGDEDGRVYPFIHNAVGRSICDESGVWQIDYEWAETQPPHAFFRPDPKAAWVRRARSEPDASPYYWPLSAFVLDDVLYVGLLRVQPAEANGPFNLPFRLVGADLARIENADETPGKWRVEISALSETKRAIPGSAWVVEGEFAYAFSYRNDPGARTPQILTRLPVSALMASPWPKSLADQLETLNQRGRWEMGFSPSRARILMEDDATEMSVHYSLEEDAWLAVYSDPTPASAHAQKGVIWLRRAAALDGPWSTPQPLAIIPEQRTGNALAADPNLFCYAGKAHPQFSAPEELVVTYVCNLFARTEKEIPGTLKRLSESPGIYRPRAMRIKIPPPSDR